MASKLQNEKVIRLDNGFPTTKREKDAFDARQERNMKAAAEAMGIVVPNKKKPGAKVRKRQRWVLAVNYQCMMAAGRSQRPLRLWLGSQVQEVLWTGQRLVISLQSQGFEGNLTDTCDQC